MKMILSPALRPSVTVLSRSRRLLVAAMLPILVAGFLFAPVHAQTSTSAVPNFISYQGKVSEATGAFVGANAPVNRTVTFRIWSSPSSSTVTDLIYSEQQTVSISGGEFSVLIGQGSAVSGTPLGYNESAKHTTSKVGAVEVFATTTRYLGVTIDDGNPATTDPEISPRQQLVSSAYAFRAKYAESLGSSGVSTIKVLDSGNVGIGTDNPGAKLEVAGAVKANGASGFIFGGTGDADGGLFSPADGVVTINTNNVERMRVDANGNLGIGTSTPSAKLDVASATAGAQNIAITKFNNGTASENSGNLLFDNYGPANTARSSGTELGSIYFRSSQPSSAAIQNSARIQAIADGQTGPNTPAALTFAVVPSLGTLVEAMRITSAGAVALRSTVNNNVPRPALQSTRIPGEINGSNASSLLSDDGFLRLSAGGGTTATTKAYIDLSGYSTTADMNSNLVFGTQGTERMRISNNGNVGIGTSSPTAKLDVAGAVTVSGNVGIGTTAPSAALHVAGGIKLEGKNVFEFGAGLTKQVDAGKIGYNLFGDSDALDIVGAGTAGTNRKIQFYNEGGAFFVGNVGIGTTSPRAPLHVRRADYSTPNHTRKAGSDTAYGVYLSGNGAAAWPDGFSNSIGDNETIYYGVLSAIFEGEIVSRGLWIGSSLSYSDARAKTVLGSSDATRDLSLLRELKIRDYTWIDRTMDNHRAHKKLLAQEVEQVFPQAVQRTPKPTVIPNIYQVADKLEFDPAEKELRLTVGKPHDLKVGDAVDLHTDEAPLSNVKVTAVIGDREFVVACEKAPKSVFVYGKYVTDFRAVDYDAIAMLNVSATQELARQVDALKASEARNAELVRRVAELEAKDRTRDTRLSAIEKLLQSSSTVIALPAKSATASGQQ